MISLAAVYFGLAYVLHCIKSMNANTKKGGKKMETTEIKYNEEKGLSWEEIREVGDRQRKGTFGEDFKTLNNWKERKRTIIHVGSYELRDINLIAEYFGEEFISLIATRQKKGEKRRYIVRCMKCDELYDCLVIIQYSQVKVLGRKSLSCWVSDKK